MQHASSQVQLFRVIQVSVLCSGEPAVIGNRLSLRDHRLPAEQSRPCPGGETEEVRAQGGAGRGGEGEALSALRHLLRAQ